MENYYFVSQIGNSHHILQMVHMDVDVHAFWWNSSPIYLNIITKRVQMFKIMKPTAQSHNFNTRSQLLVPLTPCYLYNHFVASVIRLGISCDEIHSYKHYGIQKYYDIFVPVYLKHTVVFTIVTLPYTAVLKPHIYFWKRMENRN